MFDLCDGEIGFLRNVNAREIHFIQRDVFGQSETHYGNVVLRIGTQFVEVGHRFFVDFRFRSFWRQFTAPAVEKTAAVIEPVGTIIGVFDAINGLREVSVCQRITQSMLEQNLQ